MAVDPRLRAYLEQMPDVDPRSLPLDVQRRGFEALAAQRGADGSVPLARVEDGTLPGPGGAPLRFRLYAPRQGRPGTGLPAIVYFHGGGFVLGSIDAHDATTRRLARASDCAVISIDYRLAPEAPFPAAVEDAEAAVGWTAAQGAELGVDPERIAVAGDSAGGNLAAGVAHRLRDRGGPRLAHQLLIYPVTNHAFDTPSYEANAEGYFLTRRHMQWFWEQYLAGDPARGADPQASLLRAEDFSGLPSATVITAEHDPLRDEGRAYAEALARAGVDALHRDFAGMIHGFVAMSGLVEQADEALALGAERLRRSLGLA